MKRVTGKIDISALNVPPEKHEYSTAVFFAKRGKDIVFIKPSDIKRQHTPDFAMDGKMWEVKSPVVYSKSSFEDNLRRAVKQSEHIIYDLRRLKLRDETVYIKELKKWSRKRKVRTLIIITRDGQLLTTKGEFDILES
jgi:hypothetical protein